MNGLNGIEINGNVYGKKKNAAKHFDDPEYEAEVRYAKENGLELPKVPEPIAKPDKHNPRALSQRNRSKSTSDVKAPSPPSKAKSDKAERKARNRAISGNWSKKNGNRNEYGMDEDFEDDYAVDFDDTVIDDSEDEYVDYVFKYDSVKVCGTLDEYFSNPNCDEAINELSPHLYNKDTGLRVTREVITKSLELDHSRVALGYRLMVELLKTKHINEKTIYMAFDELLGDLENLLKDMPKARENLTLFIAKTVNDKLIPRLLFDDITSKLNENRLAMSCALEVYCYLNNPVLLKGKFEACGGFEPLEELDTQMERILREFLLSGDYAEVGKRLDELHAQHYNHEIVYLAGYYAINKMNEKTMEKLVKLLKYLIDEGYLLRSSLKPGFEHLFKSLSELYIDLPAAYSLCELWVNKCQVFLDESIINDFPKPSGKRARTLSESDENGKIYVLDNQVPIQNGV